MSIVTIIFAENIQNPLRKITILLNTPSFGNMSARGRIIITKITAIQVRRNSNSYMLFHKN
jgi:hypothetical protein